MPRATFSSRLSMTAASVIRVTRWVLTPWTKIRNRRQLAELSDRQLRDCGIDLSLAARGKAAAVNAATLRRLQSLSHG